MKLSKRVKTLQPSTTLEITAKAVELKSQGHNVIGLGAGEPDFNTPTYILNAAKEAMDLGYTKYTPTGGLLTLKTAICNKMQQDHQLQYAPSEIIVCNGAKHALYTLFQAILDEGDEVIIPTPYWVSYPEQVGLAGGKSVYVEGFEKNNYKVTVEQLKEVANEKTKAIIINSPSNPTGMIYSIDELTSIGEFCLANNILIISDEIYEKLTYNGAKHTSIAQISPELKAQTVIINGVSKSHAMTGWRIGYAIGNAELIKAMTNIASHSTSNPTSIAQHATIAAYECNGNELEEMRVAFEERLNTIFDKLIQIKGFTCIKPEGAFYLFPNVLEASNLAGFHSVDEFVSALLTEEKVAVIPGSSFGAPNNIRLSYATSLDDLEEAVERIGRFMNSKIIVK